MESRLVGLEHAEVNNAWSNQQAASVDNFSFRRNIHLPSGKNAVALQQKNTPLAGLPCRIDKSAVGYGEKSVHAHPSTPLALRVSTSRQAMRTATPISTCSVDRKSTRLNSSHYC